MTLSVAWIRKVNKTEELVIATDSRLRWGRAWDSCPKIFPLSRQDSVICFAGMTEYAYPIMAQVNNAVSMYRKSATRAMDITDLKGHILRMIEGMRTHIHDLPSGKDAFEKPEAMFLLAGFSWKTQTFKIWTLYYNEKIGEFSFRKASSHRKRTDGSKFYAFIGDNVSEARTKTLELLKERGKLDTPGLDMEPFEVLRDMIRSDEFPRIGGPPQIVKIYKHMNVMPYTVYWPNKESGKKTYLGRPLLDYEDNDFLNLDPDTLEVGESNKSMQPTAEAAAD